MPNERNSHAAPQDVGRSRYDSRPVRPIEIFAWALYDWANSAYSAISITILVAYIKYVVLPGGAGTIAWGWGIGLSMFTAALLSPILGAVADAHASKWKWLAGTALPGAVAAVLMSLAPDDQPWLVIGLFFLTSLLYELSLGFYNGFLPELATPETMNRVSAWGFALGYIGGALPLLGAMLIVEFGGSLGLPAGTGLTGDFHATADGEFRVAMPPGSYDVEVTLGDAAEPRYQMTVSVNGAPLGAVSTSAGESAVKKHLVTVAGQPISIDLKTLDGGQAAIEGLTLVQKGGPYAARFDFGTAGSAIEKGYLRVLPTDHVTAWRRDALVEERGEQVEVRALPQELSFGWERGTITAQDRIVPPRLRLGLLLMALWWGLFTLPCVFILRDRCLPARQPEPLHKAARTALAEVGRTIRNVRKYRMLALFLVAFLIYNEGMQTVLSQASVFAIEVLRMGSGELAKVVLMIQFLALPGAILVGKLADRYGQKQILLCCLAVWTVILIAAFFVTTPSQFWIMGGVIAMVMGGSQSISRAIMGMMTPVAHTAEFFGFFNLSGKATSFIGPIVFSSVLYVTKSAHLAIVCLLVFFVVGSLLAMRLDVDRGQREASQP